MRGDRSREVLTIEYWLGKEVFWVGGRFLWEVVADTRRSNHWALTGKKSYLGGWSHLVGGGRLQQVLIIEHWLEKTFSGQVVASYWRWSLTRGSNHWALTGKKVLSGGWLHLVRGGHLQEVLIIEHWLEKKFSGQVVTSCGRWSFTRGSRT